MSGELRLSAARESRSGVALVIILAFLVLIFAMAVAFLGSIVTERASSSSYATSTTTRQLGDMAVNLVQAQIQHASTQSNGNTPMAWASQPGMARTFNQDGSLATAYKLYSDAAMTASAIDAPAMTQNLANWKADTALYTDLNAPVQVTRNTGGSSAPQYVYPILDPSGVSASGGKSAKIDGFSIQSAPSATQTQPAPMPVRWLYVLRDGTLTAGSGAGTTATISEASKDNPIVGRIAFWTDDETCKLNINTAAHGSRWDIPRIMAEDEALPFVRYQPTIREFQRYPGHPAMTSLAPVFGYLFGVNPQNTDPYANLVGSQEKSFADFIYDIVPRVESGGSELATRSVSSVALSSAPLVLDNDRLYASLDELIFNPSRGVQNSGGLKIDRPTLEAAKFFLTAHSRAPEVNLFQKPRISMWPINDGTNQKLPSSLDRLLAFCSTVNNIPFYLQRSEPDDPETDISKQNNRALRNYLRGLLADPFPGFGSDSFVDKYKVGEAYQISTEILDYIRASNIMSVTTYGATKFSTDVTGRNHPETADAVGTRGGQVSPIIDEESDTKGFGRIPTISRAVLQFYISDIKARPAGNPTGTPISVVSNRRPIPASGADSSAYLPRLDSLSHPKATPPIDGKNGVDYDIETEAVLYFDFFDAMAGYPVSDYNFDLIVEFGGGWSVTPVPTVATTPPPTTQGLAFPSGVRVPMRYNGYHGYDFSLISPPSNPRMAGMGYGYRLGGGRSIVSPMMGFLGFNRTFRDTINNVTGQGGGDGVDDFYQLVSVPVRLHRTMKTVVTTVGTTSTAKFVESPKIVGPGSTTGAPEFQDRFSFSGGSVKVKIVVNDRGGTNAANDHVIQEFDFDFPGFTKPVPSYAPPTAASLDNVALANTQAKQMAVDMDFSYRIRGNPSVFTPLGATAAAGDTSSKQVATYLTQPGDIIVSLEPAYGDPRLIAGKSHLTTAPNYSGGQIQQDFVPHEDYFKGSSGSVSEITNRHAYSFRVAAQNYRNAVTTAPYGPTSNLAYPVFGRFIGGLDYGRNAMPNLPSRWRNGVPVFSLNGGSANFLPDFDTGMAYMQDGPYINRADEGAIVAAEVAAWPWSGADVVAQGDQGGFYSPNKQMAGAGMLGSLPTGVRSGNPWQTLLFRPDPDKRHPGSVNPPDYLMLDLFWMPVVEPYAISEPLSTAGKINLNHQILPFTYINRDTALRGLLLKEEIPAVLNNILMGANADTDLYKRILVLQGGGLPGMPPSHQSRNRINLSATIEAINTRFQNGGAYLSEAEICGVPLIPEGQSYAANFAYNSPWWSARTATGDNMRERPYTNIVPRLTTKSNSYTVHYRVQTLGKRSNSSPTVWEEGKDVVAGEYRGSSTIERFIDPNLDLASWNTAESTPSLGSRYQWRTLNTTQFAP